MGDELDAVAVMALGDGEVDEGVEFGLGEGRLAGHDPEVAATGDADEGGLVGVVEVGDEKGGFEGPEELHAPIGVGFTVVDKPGGSVGFKGAFGGAAAEGEGGGDGAVGIKGVRLDGVDGVAFDPSGDVGQDIPIAHEAREVDVKIHGLEWGMGGGLAAGLEGSGHDKEHGEAGEVEGPGRK